MLTKQTLFKRKLSKQYFKSKYIASIVETKCSLIEEIRLKYEHKKGLIAFFGIKGYTK